jgi:hypothetical protein
LFHANDCESCEVQRLQVQGRPAYWSPKEEALLLLEYECGLLSEFLHFLEKFFLVRPLTIGRGSSTLSRVI